jgi:6-phosphogluconolactonase (cycloisomerase 2 family)
MGTRRHFLAGATGFAATIAAGGCAVASRPGVATRRRAMFAYVGCYTSKERKGRGEGIAVYRIDAQSGEWTAEHVVKGVVNPSWLTLDRERRRLYAAHGDGTDATAFSIDSDSGRVALLNRQPTKGRNGVRLAVDPSNSFAVVANYASGTVAVLPIKTDGSLGAVTDVFTLRGKPGPHRTEQTSSHPHDVVFEPGGRFLVVPDKGFDATFVFRLDAARGKLVPAEPGAVTSRPGAGPRHIDFHPLKPYLYQINELDSTITTFKFDTERSTLAPLQTLTTLPTGFTGTSTTAEIAVAPSGRFVYGSNRGHDSIAIFAVDDATGTLSAVGWESTQGRTPRFFALDPSGAFLYAANQDSDTIVAFSVDQGTGKLKPTGQVVKTGSPSSIVFR